MNKEQIKAKAVQARDELSAKLNEIIEKRDEIQESFEESSKSFKEGINTLVAAF